MKYIRKSGWAEAEEKDLENSKREIRGPQEGGKKPARGRLEARKREARGPQEGGKRPAGGRQEAHKREARGPQEGGKRPARGRQEAHKREARGPQEGGKRPARGRQEYPCFFHKPPHLLLKYVWKENVYPRWQTPYPPPLPPLGLGNSQGPHSNSNISYMYVHRFKYCMYSVQYVTGNVGIVFIISYFLVFLRDRKM